MIFNSSSLYSQGSLVCCSLCGDRVRYDWTTELNWPAIHKWHSDQQSAWRSNMGSIAGLGRSLGGRNSSPLQYSCLENSMDRGAWWTGYCEWGHKELDTTEHTHAHTQRILNSISHKRLIKKVLLNTFKSKWQETRGEIPNLRPLFISNCWHFWTSESWQSHLLGSIRETSLCLPQDLPLTNNAYTKF